MKKRILSLLLCLIMLMSLAPLAAFAEGEAPEVSFRLTEPAYDGANVLLSAKVQASYTDAEGNPVSLSQSVQGASVSPLGPGGPDCMTEGSWTVSAALSFSDPVIDAAWAAISAGGSAKLPGPAYAAGHSYNNGNVSVTAAFTEGLYRISVQKCCDRQGLPGHPTGGCQALGQAEIAAESAAAKIISENKLPCTGPVTLDLKDAGLEFSSPEAQAVWDKLESKLVTVPQAPHSYVEGTEEDPESGHVSSTRICKYCSQPDPLFTPEFTPGVKGLIGRSVDLKFAGLSDKALPVSGSMSFEITEDMLGPVSEAGPLSPLHSHKLKMSLSAEKYNELFNSEALKLKDALGNELPKTGFLIGTNKSAELNFYLNKETKLWETKLPGGLASIVLPILPGSQKSFSLNFKGDIPSLRPGSVDVKLYTGPNGTLRLSAPGFEKTQVILPLYDYKKLSPDSFKFNYAQNQQAEPYVFVKEMGSETEFNFLLPDGRYAEARIHQLPATKTALSINLSLSGKDFDSQEAVRTFTFQLNNTKRSSSIAYNSNRWDDGRTDIVYPRYDAEGNSSSYSYTVSASDSGLKPGSYQDKLLNNEVLLSAGFDEIGNLIIDAQMKFSKEVMLIPEEGCVFDKNEPMLLDILCRHKDSKEEFKPYLPQPVEVTWNEEKQAYYAGLCLPETDTDEASTPMEYKLVPLEENNPYVFTLKSETPALSTFSFKNYVSPALSINIQKLWEDNGNELSRRESVKVKLLQNGLAVGQEFLLTADEAAQLLETVPGTQEPIPACDKNKNPYTYSLRILSVLPHYTLTSGKVQGSEADANGVVNLPFTAKLHGYFNLTVRKQFEGGGKYPDSVQVDLYRDNLFLKTYTIPIKEDGSGCIKLKGFWDYKTADYKLVEKPVEGYYASYGEVKSVPGSLLDKEILITNHPMEYFDLTVQKIWKNTVQPKPFIEVKLYADGTEITDGWVKIERQKNEETGRYQWIGLFPDLPVYNSQGQEIDYRVREKRISFFKTEISEMSEDNVITITNTRIDRGVKTGDESNLGLWLTVGGVALVAIAAVAVIVIKKGKVKDEDEDDEDQTE